jgi:hypothetical protein
MKTGIISFNVKDRGRQYRGQDRNFDCVALARVINGPEVQERVRNRDLHGYYGHLPRRLFGMNPGEGGIYRGQHVRIEPALVTTTLRALDDGTIEHEEEFLDTPPGRSAKRLFSSRAGGWSSAITCDETATRLAGRDIASGFFGFDYVAEPNYATNRGFALDGVSEEDGVVLDAVTDSQSAIVMLDGLYNALQAEFDAQALALARAQAECAELVALLARRPAEFQAHARGQLARLDSAEFERKPNRVMFDDARLSRMAREFDSMEDLPTFVEPEPEGGKGNTGLVERLSRAVSTVFGAGR